MPENALGEDAVGIGNDLSVGFDPCVAIAFRTRLKEQRMRRNCHEETKFAIGDLFMHYLDTCGGG